jgi:hypothetical protein
MDKFNLKVFVGNTDLNKQIASGLVSRLNKYGVTSDSSRELSLIICTPEYIKMFDKYPVLVLTDDLQYLHDSNVVEVTPFPVTEDDILRLEFRTVKVIEDLKYVGQD